MLTVRAVDFGPIEDAEVTLRPLTVLVGPNNTGKSYFAMLAYAELIAGGNLSTLDSTREGTLAPYRSNTYPGAENDHGEQGGRPFRLRRQGS